MNQKLFSATYARLRSRALETLSRAESRLEGPPAHQDSDDLVELIAQDLCQLAQLEGALLTLQQYFQTLPDAGTTPPPPTPRAKGKASPKPSRGSGSRVPSPPPEPRGPPRSSSGHGQKPKTARGQQPKSEEPMKVTREMSPTLKKALQAEEIRMAAATKEAPDE